jgi:hypothetical protein
MKNRKQKIVPVLKDSYLQVIKNSKGTKLFRNFYATVDGRQKDILRNGDLSCAYFVSCVLRIFDLIGKVHVSVDGTEADMKKSGWRGTKNVKQGCVLLWEAKKSGRETHRHIGFYIGNKKAISNSFEKRIPVEHSSTFGGKRRIQAIYWHKRLE